MAPKTTAFMSCKQLVAANMGLMTSCNEMEQRPTHCCCNFSAIDLQLVWTSQKSKHKSIPVWKFSLQTSLVLSKWTNKTTLCSRTSLQTQVQKKDQLAILVTSPKENRTWTTILLTQKIRYQSHKVESFLQFSHTAKYIHAIIPTKPTDSLPKNQKTQMF